MTSISEKLNRAIVGIAGLGGLGSNVAVALARGGVGRLVIVDFDTIDKSNLNRQQYFTDQIGEEKVSALTENLKRVNPQVSIEGHKVKLDAGNIPDIFADCEVIAECFDKAEEKQMLVEAVLGKMDKPVVVSVSGLAGYGNSNAIKTRRISERLILIGDNESGIDTVGLLTAARVGIAACHQANAIIEVILDGNLKSYGIEKKFPEEQFPQTVAELLEQLKIEAATVVAEVDGQIVKREKFSQTKLHKGQSIELVRFVPGG